jgi:hypothetical protein
MYGWITHLLPINNEELPASSDSNIPRTEPPIPERRFRRLFVIEITIRNQRAPDNQLTLLALVSHIAEVFINKSQLNTR